MRVLSALFFGFALLVLAACSGEPADDFMVKDSPYFNASDALITIDGLPIRYRDEGAKGAPTIVMIHGFTSSLETWDGVADILKGDYRIIRLDLPGHGLTGPDAQARYSNADTVRFVSDFLDALDIQNPTLVGNSLGGLVAWRLAQSRPDGVAKLVLISPGGFSINGVTETPVAVPLMVKLYLTKAPEAGVRQATAALYGDPSKLSETRLRTIMDMMERPGNGDAFVTRAETFTLPDPNHDLKTVATPTLILWGDKDIMVPPAHGEKFAATMPNAALTPLDGMGHVPQEEAPELTANLIHQFIQQQE
ncbi:alpha/beta fold hydrolase [Fretibacter rubidus]|uniref:alpha/beta fold hydrolase n=1 Tax=Fretibacter rubidus TaxID=570162 RepID=UPI00352BCA5E